MPALTQGTAGTQRFSSGQMEESVTQDAIVLEKFKEQKLFYIEHPTHIFTQIFIKHLFHESVFNVTDS